MAFDLGHFAPAPAFVGRLVASARSDREGRDDLQVEGRGVVVIDQDDDIGLLHLLPGPGPFIAREDRAEIIVLVLALVRCHAEQGDMARRQAGGDAGHQRLSLIERLPSGERPPAIIILV